MYHLVTRSAKPSKIWDFIDLVNVKCVLNVMTMFRNFRGKFDATAFAFSTVAIESIFPVHVILEIVFSLAPLGETGDIHVLRSINRRSFSGRRLIALSIRLINPSALIRVWRHSLIERLAFIFAMRDKRIGQSKPLPLIFHRECSAIIITMPFRQICQSF